MVALLTGVAIALFEDSCLDLGGFLWHLRPPHISEDFTALVGLVRTAFALLSESHQSWSTWRLHACIVDDKWCAQTEVCNARDLGFAWEFDPEGGYVPRM